MAREENYNRELSRQKRRGGRAPQPYSPEQFSQEWNFISSGIKSVLKANPSFGAVILFGSWAIGDADPNSDLDLIFLYIDPNNLPPQDELAEDVRRHCGKFEPSVHQYLHLDENRLRGNKKRVGHLLEKGVKIIANDTGEFESIIRRGLSLRS